MWVWVIVVVVFSFAWLLAFIWWFWCFRSLVVGCFLWILQYSFVYFAAGVGFSIAWVGCV